MIEQKPVPRDEKTVELAIILNWLEDRDAAHVMLAPIQNVPDLWTAFGYLMEAVGVTAAMMSQQTNPKDIKDYETMAQYVSEYITGVIMKAEPNDPR